VSGFLKYLGISVDNINSVEGSDGNVISSEQVEVQNTLENVESSIDSTEKVLKTESVEINTSTAATGAATFVIAYAIHKCFAPVRIATTLTATPFIVRHLRKIGFLKGPKV